MVGVGMSEEEQHQAFRVTAAILHLGNVTYSGDEDDKAAIDDKGNAGTLCA